MKKKILPLAIATAMAPGFATAADVSGFADIIYTIADDQPAGSTSPSTTEGKFTAEGEIDFSASPAEGVTVRLDVDLSINANDNTGLDGESGSIEQAFFAWNATEGVTVLGGVFNNPIGLEAEDAPDMWGTNHGVVYNILDNQTALDGDNVAGLAVAGAVGPATVTLAYINETAQTNEENSIALVVNATPIEGLDLELGFVSQSDQATRDATTGDANGTDAHTVVGLGAGESAGDVTNFNVSYVIPGVEGLSVALDYLVADKIVDSAYELMIDYSYDKFGVGVRLEEIGYQDPVSTWQDTERTTFHFSYEVASNLVAILEVADGDDKNPQFGVEADSLTTLELIATF